MSFKLPSQEELTKMIKSLDAKDFNEIHDQYVSEVNMWNVLDNLQQLEKYLAQFEFTKNMTIHGNTDIATRDGKIVDKNIRSSLPASSIVKLSEKRNDIMDKGIMTLSSNLQDKNISSLESNRDGKVA